MVRALGSSRLPSPDIVLLPALRVGRGGCPCRAGGPQTSEYRSFVA
jgi:hypothetical protein